MDRQCVYTEEVQNGPNINIWLTLHAGPSHCAVTPLSLITFIDTMCAYESTYRLPLLSISYLKTYICSGVFRAYKLTGKRSRRNAVVPTRFGVDTEGS